MAFNFSPKIVTNGLVLALDAANTKSYPGSGTVWSDLTPNGNNGALTNGPTFNSANGGSIVFDGTNDYLQGVSTNYKWATSTGETTFLLVRFDGAYTDESFFAYTVNPTNKYVFFKKTR